MQFTAVMSWIRNEIYKLYLVIHIRKVFKKLIDVIA